MNISLVQSNIKWENKQHNISRAEEVIHANGSDVFLFPEMSFTGFSMNTEYTGDANEETTVMIRDLAIKYAVTIGFGWVRKKSGKCENVYTIIDRNGEKISEYVKIHPFSFTRENNYFVGGKKIIKYMIENIPFSTFVCYDLRFPELFRSVAQKVHAIVLPANWPQRRSEHWKTLLKARAIENQVYIFAVNCVGNMDGQYYSGDSCVVNPNGDIVTSISDKEGVVSFDFIDDAEKFRSEFPVLDDIVDIGQIEVKDANK